MAEPPAATTELSVVIVNWNVYELAARCVASLAETVEATGYEVILVDNSQSPAGRELWSRSLPRGGVRCVFNPANLGFAAAVNQALRVARGRDFLLLNPDARPARGTVDAMCRTLAERPEIGVLTCRLVRPDGRAEPSAYVLDPSPLRVLLDLTGLRYAWLALAGRRAAPAPDSEPREVAWVKGACMLVRGRAARDVGPFDEGFFLYAEDSDWCRRARQAGWKVALLPGRVAVHEGQRSVAHDRRGSLGHYYASYRRYLRKHGRPGLRTATAAALLGAAAGARLATLAGPRLGARRLLPRRLRRGLLWAYYAGRDAAGRLAGRRDLPPRRIAFVGQGSFERVGAEWLARCRDLGGLRPEGSVLDVGCGSGRLALPLAGYLTSGTYAGFDPVPAAIAWCQEHITSGHPNFQFQQVDLRNGEYNPRGVVDPARFRFPYPDRSFDLAVLHSVLTHLLPDAVDHYLREVARVLKVGGRVLATFFLLNREAQALARAGLANQDFRHRLEGCWTVDRRVPEAAVAYEEDVIRALYRRRGLQVEEPIRYGGWCGRPEFLDNQDLVVAVRRARRPASGGRPG